MRLVARGKLCIQMPQERGDTTGSGEYSAERRSGIIDCYPDVSSKLLDTGPLRGIAPFRSKCSIHQDRSQARHRRPSGSLAPCQQGESHGQAFRGTLRNLKGTGYPCVSPAARSQLCLPAKLGQDDSIFGRQR
jgi:hypothetical protein